jgi:hypothetical protein
VIESRPMRVVAIALLLASCAPSAWQVRQQTVLQTRDAARRLPGARQAQQLAEAVHAACRAGDYQTQRARLQKDAQEARDLIDQTVPNAGVDAATLVAWRALLDADLGQYREANQDFLRSFQLAPNALAGRSLIVIYGGANETLKVGETCNATLPVLPGDDDRLELIALCRKNMNAASKEGEMAWMSPALVQWYQAENARRLGAAVDAIDARAERERQERFVLRESQQCTAACRQGGLLCQNDCYGDGTCQHRCVQANRACADGCTSRAYQQLGY